MSRRKQAKPRALKREEDWEPECGEEPSGDTTNVDDMIPPAAGDEGSPAPTATGESSSPPPSLVRQSNEDMSSTNILKGEEDEEKAPVSADSGQPHYDVTLEGLQLALLDRRNYPGANTSMSEAFLSSGAADTAASSRLLSPPPAASSTAGGAANVVPSEADNSLESDALGTDPGSSWRSETPEDQTSPSPSSCATPNSATDVPDAELTFTVGVTEGTPYACQFCDKAFPRLSYLKKHEQTHSDQMPFRCEFCSRLFKHKRSRDRHIKLHTGDKKYRCTHCEAAFSRSDHLKIHMKTHDNQKPFQCTVCNRGYNTAAALTSHMQNHKKDQQQQNGHNHSNSSRTSSNNTPSPGTFRCLQCGEIFRKPEELQGHMMTQHNVETGGSPPGAISRGLLGGLMLGDSPLARSPSRPLPFPTPKLACIYCTKDSFTTMEALQLHVQAMHGSILNGDLRDFPSLSHHQASPSPSLTPHHLLTSPNGGGSSSSNNHTVTSTSLMPYSCDLCTMRFGTVQGLQKHALAVHGLMSPSGLGLGSKDHHNESAASTPGAGLFCVQCSISFPSAALFAEHYVLLHGSTSATGSLMIPSSPVPEQLKPTDLSKKPHRHSHHHEERSPAKRHKTSMESAAAPPVSIADTSTSASSMVNQYEHPGTLLCNQCSAALPDFESFRTHLKSHLEEAGGLRGLLGGGSDIMGMLSSQDTRVNSSKSPASSGALACPHCGAKFSGADDHQAFEQHVATHFMATATEYGCQSCLKLFPKPDELQKHLIDIHAHHLYRCSLCKEMFDSKVAIQVHFAVKHSNECKLYRCTACPSSSAVFRSEMDFGLHVRSAHAPFSMLTGSTNKTPTPQPFRCLFCRLSFGTELEMQFHLAAHSKQFHCLLCQEAFHVEFLLDKHMQTHHSSQVMNSNGTNPAENVSQQQKSPKNKTCGVTPSSTAHTNSNNSSAASNSGSRNSSSNNNENVSSKKGDQSNNSTCCDICDRCDFGSEAELIAHRKLVHHIKPSTGKNGAVSLHCAYCSENCKSRTELENHMKTHSQGGSGSGKHKCNICDELCPSAAVLAEHKLTHCKVISGSTCTQCKAALVSEDQFYTHLQQHSSNNNNNNSSAQGNTNSAHQQVVLPTPCVVCRQTLISDIEVRMHARFHLKNSAALTATEPMYQCCLCMKQFEMQNLIVASGSNGVIPNVQGATYICKDCYHCHSKTSPSQQQQNSQPQHQMGHSLQEQGFRCSECQVKFETSTALEAHLVSVHRKTYQCIKCQVSFESEREIQMHVATHLLTEGSSHECHLCRRLLATPLKLQAHLIEHTFAGCGSFTCYLCSAVFTAAQGLQQHMLEHGLAARPYDCSRCSLRFFFRAELDNHSYSHLEEDAVAMANPSALLDGADMAGKAAYYHHLNTNGTYESSNSDMHYYKTLVQESTKQQKHKSNKSSSNKGLGVLKCLECNKEFSSIVGLQAHQRHHKHSPSSNKKSYICNECGKEFAVARNLSVHMRSHHGDHSSEDRISEDLNIASDEHYQAEGTKHSCPVCHKDFSDVEALNSHVSSQHFRCSQCGEVFIRQRHVTDHIRKVHSMEDEEYLTDINTAEMKQEPVSVKEENEDENIDVSSLTPTADQQYDEQVDRHTPNTQSNEASHSNSHPSSPNTTQPSNTSDDRTSLSPTSPRVDDNAH